MEDTAVRHFLGVESCGKSLEELDEVYNAVSLHSARSVKANAYGLVPGRSHSRITLNTKEVPCNRFEQIPPCKREVSPLIYKTVFS
jgi:hypothetical protein